MGEVRSAKPQPEESTNAVKTRVGGAEDVVVPARKEPYKEDGGEGQRG